MTAFKVIHIIMPILLLKCFLEQQKRKWSEQTAGVALAVHRVCEHHPSCSMWWEKVESFWVLYVPGSLSVLKFWHPVTAVSRAFTVVKQCIVGISHQRGDMLKIRKGFHKARVCGELDFWSQKRPRFFWVP